MKFVEKLFKNLIFLKEIYYLRSFFLGFSSGVPLLLTASCLAMRMKAQTTFSYEMISLISLAAIPYALKFPIALILNKVLQIKFLPKYNNYKGWLILSQFIVISCLMILSYMDISKNFLRTFIFVLIVNIAAAFQSCLTSVYPIHCHQKNLNKNIAAAFQVTGLRVGILIAGAGTLFLSQLCNNWNVAYLIVTISLFLGLFGSFTLNVENSNKGFSNKKIYKNYTSYLINVIKSLNNGKSVFACLALMFIYKIGDNLIGPLKNLFYLDVGFSRYQIAISSKILGMISAIIGASIGHYLLASINFKKSLIYCMICHGVCVLLYLILQNYPYMPIFATIAIVDNFSSGIRGFMLYSLQINLCDKNNYIEQMSILVSIEHFSRNILGSFAGVFFGLIGWNGLFVFSTLLYIIPVMLISKTNFKNKTN